MNSQTQRLNGAAKVLVVAAKKPLFPELVGNAVVVSDRLVHDDLFTTAPVFSLTCPFHNWCEGREELSRQIPGLPAEKATEMCAKLDRRGITRIGSAVQCGDILVGRIAPINPNSLTSEERLISHIFGRTTLEDEKRDKSLYYRFRDAGTVCNVEVLAWQRYRCTSCGDIPWHDSSLRKCPFCDGPLADRQSDNVPSGVMYVVKVDVIVRRKLCVGDILRDGKGNEFTVARIVQQRDMPHFQREDVDVLVAADSSIAPHLHREGTLRKQRKWHKTNGDRIRLEKVTLQSSEKIVYRGLGPTSKFTYLPTASDIVFSGQKVNEAMVKTLLHDGYVANVREMLSIKADSDKGRRTAYEALVKGEHVPFGVPETTNRLWTLLKALCFAPRLVDENGTEVELSAEAGSAASLAFQAMTTTDVRVLSFGEVKTPETLNARTYRPVQDGIFCERIFGPERDWECGCGKYRGLKYEGMICDRCGVKVTHSQVRRKRFGHIELAMPVMHPWYLKAVSDMLGLPQEEVQKVLFYHQELDASLATRKGPLAIKEYLAQKGANTTGVFLEAIPVLPAGLRPLFLGEDGNWHYAQDCHDLYRRVINRSNRFRKFSDLNAPLVLIESEHRMLQGTVEALFLNEISTHPVVNDHDAPLHSLRWELTHLLKQVMEKRVDYSGRMVVIPNAELQRSTVGVPAKALYDMYKPFVIREIKARGLADTIKSATKLIEREPNRSDVREALGAATANHPILLVTHGQTMGAFQPVIAEGEAMHLHPDDAERLGVRFAGEQVTLHLPLSAAAVAEMREPHPLEDTSSHLLDLNPDNLPEMVTNHESFGLKPLDKIVLGIGQ